MQGMPLHIDTLWFKHRIAESPHGSLSRVARKMQGRTGRPLEPSMLSLMLRGKREMRLDEARQLANLLGVPLIEVLRHVGLPL